MAFCCWPLDWPVTLPAEAAREKVEPVYLSRTIVDTFWQKSKDSIVYRPKLVTVKVPDTVELPGLIDSMAVAIDYFTRRFYVDTLANDSTLLVIISDTVFKKPDNQLPGCLYNETTLLLPEP